MIADEDLPEQAADGTDARLARRKNAAVAAA
jgi:hypothetical protein